MLHGCEKQRWSYRANKKDGVVVPLELMGEEGGKSRGDADYRVEGEGNMHYSSALVLVEKEAGVESV